ncbi:MAG: M14 family murein peptide amidase A [Bacteroidota bacterium]
MQNLHEGAGLYQSVIESPIAWETAGQSVQGRDIYVKTFGQGERTVMIIGGFHGDEIRGVELALRFAEYLHENQVQLDDVRVVAIPVLSPDGLVNQQRLNANDVDINRNFPTENWTAESSRGPRYSPGTAPASEPETRLMMALLDQYKPQRIISIHAPLEVVNYDGPAKALAEKMAAYTGYPVSGDIGYPTPGSFGNYAGVENQIPTITLELPAGPFEPMWVPNRNALLSAMKF